jgi:hypothetical protein
MTDSVVGGTVTVVSLDEFQTPPGQKENGEAQPAPQVSPPALTPSFIFPGHITAMTTTITPIGSIRLFVACGNDLYIVKVL